MCTQTHTHASCACALSPVHGSFVGQAIISKRHQGTTGAETGEDGGWGAAVWSTNPWTQDDTAGPVAEETEESPHDSLHASAAKRTSARVESIEGHGVQWNAKLKERHWERGPSSQWGQTAQEFSNSQASKEGDENRLPMSMKKWRVKKDGALKGDEGELCRQPQPLRPPA
eukprot:1148234-Pelagomonas_calceolata.AAC.2